MQARPLPVRAPARALPRAGARWTLLWLVAAAVALAAVSALIAPERAPVAAQSDLIAYTMVDQWPQRDNAAQGLFQSPSDLDVARDGRVYIADPGIGGIHTLLPSGAFTTPFGVTGGFPAQLGQVGPIAIGPGPLPGGGPVMPFGPERLYVLDTAVERVVLYDLDGKFLAQWPKVNAQSIAASGDGRVYVLDRDTSEVRALDAVTGQEKFKFGMRGADDGQFTSFTDVDVSADGRVLAVGDKRGQRVQLFDLATDEQIADPAMPAAPAKLRTVYDLTDAKYTLGEDTCDGSRINALGGDKVFVGQTAGACIIDKRTVASAIAASASRGAICRDTVTLPRHKAMTQQYYALAVNDPNAGRCGEKRTELDTTPVVVKYDDEAFRQVNTVWEAASNENSDSPILFAPEAISFPQPGVMYIADASSQLRFYSTDGQQIATAQRSSQAGNFTSDFEFFYIIRGDGSDVLGEVFGYYINGKRKGQDFTIEGGIGRFKTVEKRTQTGIEKVIEPVWTDPLVSTFEEIEVPALAWNPVSNELLVVRNETIPQQRTQDVSIVRYAPNGRELKPAFDLPDDGKSNPYVDLVVAPDGRILALDDLNDLVRIYQPDGTHVVDVPVAFDARAVAGGPISPEGSVFALREPGSIERYADDGRITARLDGRPLPFSDPVTLTDIAIGPDGRVYVSDGQSSLISVFESTTDQDEIPIPNDAECLFKGKTSINPAQVNLGQSTTVQLKLDGRCGINEEPADVVVITPYYRRLDAGVDPSATTVTEMTQLMSRVNFAKHRVGVVSYWNTTTAELPLTSDRAAYMAKVRDITRFDPPSPDVKSQLKDALEEAGQLFDASSTGRRKVVVLLRAEYCTPDFEFFPGQCTGIKPAEDTALALRQAGVTIVVVNSIQAFDLASSDEDALFGVEYVHRRMVRYAPPPALASAVNLSYAVPAGMTVDPASITNGGVWTAPNIVWDLPSVDFDGMAGAAALAPGSPGRWPVAASIVANLTDGWGNPQTVTFPIPEVEVIGPTATPVTPTATATTVPPTATPTAIPPTATATPTPEPRLVYLPRLSNNECFAVKGRFDIALVVDVSNSMQGENIEAARRSLGAFMGAVNLQPGWDQVALVDFANQARVAQDLTSDRALLDAAVGRLSTRAGTRIDQGLTAAMGVLAGPASRSYASKVIVLMSDGRQTENPASALAAGDEARGRGILLYTIGLGADADAAALTTIAGDPARYYYAPTPEQLAAVYRQIAASIPSCP